MKEGLLLLLVDNLVAIDIQQIEHILDIILSGFFQPHEAGNHLDHFGKLEFGKPPTVVLFELLENLLNYPARIRLRQLPSPCRVNIPQHLVAIAFLPRVINVLQLHLFLLLLGKDLLEVAVALVYQIIHLL